MQKSLLPCWRSPCWMGRSSIHYRLWKCALLVSGLFCCTVFCFICHIKKMQVTLRVISPFYFILKIYFVLYVGAFCLHVCLCTTSMSGDQGAQKRSTDSLNLELQVLVSCCSTKRVPGHSGPHRETLSPKTKQEEKNKTKRCSVMKIKLTFWGASSAAWWR